MLALVGSITLDESVGRAVVCEGWLFRAFELGNDAHGEDFAELDTPLVEGVDLPDCSLDEDTVLVECNELAERCGGHVFGEDDGGWAVALEGLVGDEPVGDAFGLELLAGLAEGQRFGLGEDVGHEQVVMAAEGIERLEEADEVAGDDLRSLVNELVEAVLAVG